MGEREPRRRGNEYEICVYHGSVRHGDDPFCWYANDHATAHPGRDLTVQIVCSWAWRRQAVPMPMRGPR